MISGFPLKTWNHSTFNMVELVELWWENRATMAGMLEWARSRVPTIVALFSLWAHYSLHPKWAKECTLAVITLKQCTSLLVGGFHRSTRSLGFLCLWWKFKHFLSTQINLWRVTLCTQSGARTRDSQIFI